ncbi:MAG: SoxR reducing system RseC family protein [Bacteroidales bacterium]|jgi:sigma-E factor negative regulatory protein RseC|nr:SoxR reducing system RseC family protein [Bacteroidales bacterium]MBQ2395988.1 SoxR reducing system RseC family protein [Bacteroidales bacterium]MBQ5873818.1 SoxR reducing system RseC family protein [Bacteroidales bacterium]MEE0882398.1 SoxR reducing system RseC family protein [Bacteroidales bacterium]
MKEDCVEQKGIVIKKQEDKVIVKIEQKSTCSSCHARGACTSLDKKDKEIEIKTKDTQNYNIGDEVIITISTKLGMKAVFIAFVLPLILLVIALFLSIKLFSLTQSLSALVSLLVVAAYYFFLYKQNLFLSKEFNFLIKEKITQ